MSADVAWNLAACSGHRTDLFFAQSYDTVQDKADTAEALRICRSCLIRASCLQAAMDLEGRAGRAGRYGILGGLKSGQRAGLPRPPKADEARARCGSSSGLKGHVRRGEPVCVACRAGNAAYRRGMAAKKRAAA